MSSCRPASKAAKVGTLAYPFRLREESGLWEVLRQTHDR